MDLRRNRILSFITCAFFWAGALSPFLAPSPIAAQDASPAINPPKIIRDGNDGDVVHSALSQAPLALQEWTYHKTSDHLHPDGSEQQFMWLMNRARANPAHEGAWLANTGNAQIEGAIRYWKVDLAVMVEEFNGYDAKPPAAFDVRLYNAARAHSLDLIARDAQDHSGQFDPRVDDAGFHYTQARGNVFSYTKNALHGHAAFNIDWGKGGADGDDGTGMQNPRGHRLAIMSIDGDYTNVGLAAVAESNPGTEVGPLVTTGDFCYANTRYADHYNRFVVGTVWQDGNANDQYDPGEGMAGISVMPDGGTHYAITANSGGYAFPIVSSGTYEITFSGGGINAPVSRTAAIGNTSALLDLKYTASSATEPQAVTSPASDIADTAVNLNGTVYVHGIDTQYYFQYGTTTNYGETTGMDSVSSDSTVTAVVTGLIGNTTYHYRLVATNGQGTSYGSDRAFQTTSTTTSVGSALSPSSSSGSGGGGGCFIGVLTAGSPDVGRR